MCWISNRNKGFMVNNYYSLLVGSNNCFFPWKSIWKRKIPSRVVFFCLDCCFLGMHDDCQFTKKEGLDIGLVLYLQV